MQCCQLSKPFTLCSGVALLTDFEVKKVHKTPSVKILSNLTRIAGVHVQTSRIRQLALVLIYDSLSLCGNWKLYLSILVVDFLLFFLVHELKNLLRCPCSL